jgi:zinc transporter 9
MSSSVKISIATNSAIAVSKGIGWFMTGSPTLFAETIHSLADVGNQLLLHVGEVRSKVGPDRQHPFGRGQELYFWALVSAVSVFFVGCGINVYHGVHALFSPEPAQPFGPLVFGLLLFALALESYTFVVALRELGGPSKLRANLNNVTVLAVLLEDSVALLGILLTLIVGGVSFLFGPRPVFDACAAIAVGAVLGAMAIFLAMLNRRFLIDTSDQPLDRVAESWLHQQGIVADVRSLILDDEHSIVFVRADGDVARSLAVGDALKRHLGETLGKTPEAVYWKFKRALG